LLVFEIGRAQLGLGFGDTFTFEEVAESEFVWFFYWEPLKLVVMNLVMLKLVIEEGDAIRKKWRLWRERFLLWLQMGKLKIKMT